LLRLKDDPMRTAYTVDPDLDLGEVQRALVNVGSVGQPRDENPCTAYAVYDTEAGTVSLKRAMYDIEREAHRIRSAGLPPTLADRLFHGI
jgi:diadenosine tetraphosphatase ApaH/serine/threonine PP2A family protein phosphatase